MSIVFLLIMFSKIKNRYKYLPSSEYLKNQEVLFYNRYLENHSELKKRKKEGIKYSKKEFKKEILEYYIDCSSNNRIINDRRLKDYYCTRKLIMISIISLVLMISIILIENI